MDSLARARHARGAPRQLALQHLSRIESPQAFGLLLGLVGDKDAATGDRAAAVLALSSYRTGQPQWVEEVAGLLASGEPALRRAALQALASATELPRDVLAVIETMRRNDDDDDVQFLAGLLVH